MRLLLTMAAAAVLSTPALAAPDDVNADSFYLAANDLMGKGMRAMFDKRTRPMMAQLKAAATSVRSENLAATAKGAPIYCVPPAARKKGMGAEEIVARIGRLPQAQRRNSTLRQAWRAVLIRDYPCGG